MEIEFIEDLENITEEQLKKLITDKLYRLNNLYHIRNKDGQIVRFRLNKEQTQYIIDRHYRNINLKARQLGFSTLAVIDALDDCIFEEYFHAGIIAYSLDDAEKLMDKAKFAISKLPLWLLKYRTPTHESTEEIRFPNGSVFNVDTSYRGGTLSRLHVSEFGKIAAQFPKKAKEIIAGAFEAVPKNGYIDIESTAEGAEGDFYDLTQTAMGKIGKPLTSLEFKFHFFPWWQNPEYEIEADVKFDKELTEYFDYLDKDHGIKLTQNQKNWYALKKETQKELMEQEYPSYPEEAFLASGRPFFVQKRIAADIKRVQDIAPEIKTFAIKDLEGNEHSVDVKIFKDRKPDVAYAVGGDPAEGLEDGDNSALSVLDKDYNQVATYAGKLDPDLFGALLVEVAKYYNNAVIAWEVNNHGHAVENAIKLRKYYKLYRRELKEEIGKEVKDRVGWLNTNKSKMEMLDELKESHRDESLTINDVETLREMIKVTVEGNGNVIVNGKDRVVSLGISIQAIRQATIDGSHQAKVPGKLPSNKDVTTMTVEEKIRHYKRKQRA